MATKKDLVEAHAFSRRRLVTAFLSGAPGGREVEPSRPGRVLVGGAALAILLVAGAAIASVLAPQTAEDWNSVGVVVGQDVPVSYAITQVTNPATLRPLENITTAQLLFGVGFSATSVAQKTLDGVTPGPRIGIYGAPEQLPTTDEFIESSWTSCTGRGTGVTTDVDSDPDARPLAAGQSFLVSSGNHVYLIAQAPSGAAAGADQPPTQAYRYLLSPAGDQQGNLLDQIGSTTVSDAIAVDQRWLDLFPDGGELGFESIDLAGLGGPLPNPPPGVADARVGDYVVTDDGGALVLTAAGEVRLDAFAAGVYEHSTAPKVGRQPHEVKVSTPPGGTQVGLSAIAPGVHWPVGVVTSVPDTELCAVLQTGRGPAAVQLADQPGADATSVGVAGGTLHARVEPGHGAYVDSSDNGVSAQTPFVISDEGQADLLQGADTLSTLTYTTYGDPPLVPSAWIALFERGVPLSHAAALCPPNPKPGATCAP